MSTITPEQFAQLVHRSDDREIQEVLQQVGAEPALDRIFEGMRDRYRPERTGGEEAVIQFVITDEGQEHPYVVTIQGATCEVRRGRDESPRVTLTCKLVTFVKLTAGKATGPSLFMQGKLKVAGDVMFAPRIMSFFEVPKA